MPRDMTETESPRDILFLQTPVTARKSEPACYLCGAWADDPRRCRRPGSTACIQTSSRFALDVQPPRRAGAEALLGTVTYFANSPPAAAVAPTSAK